MHLILSYRSKLFRKRSNSVSWLLFSSLDTWTGVFDKRENYIFSFIYRDSLCCWLFLRGRKKECAHYIRSRGVRMYVYTYVCILVLVEKYVWGILCYRAFILCSFPFSLNSFHYKEDVSIDNDGNGSEEICYYYSNQHFLTQKMKHIFSSLIFITPNISLSQK